MKSVGRAPTLLILEPAGLDGRGQHEAARALGYDAVPIWHRPGQPDVTESPRGGYETDLSLPGAADALAGLAGKLEADGITTALEYLVGLTAEAAGLSGLLGNRPELASSLRSKLGMGECFRSAGVRAPRTAVVESLSAALALADSGEFGYPLVIKPAGRAGSLGVTVVTERDQIGAAFRRAAEPGTAPYRIATDDRVLIQQFISGEEYSVESVTQRGTSTHVCVTDKDVTSGAARIEVGHNVPAELAPEVEAEIHRQATLALSAVGIQNSVSHVEVIVDAHGKAWVIELAARIGAGQIAKLVEFACGTSLPAASAQVAVGAETDLRRTGGHRFAASRLFRAGRPGTIAAIEGLPAVSAVVPVVEVTRKPGSAVTSAHDNSARAGLFIVVGDSRPQVREEADALLSRIRVEVVDQ